jgi:predicted DNA-binding helix-hairpin-helix protein
MDLWQKVNLLGEAAQYDTCQGCGTHTHRMRDDIGRWIYPAVRPDGTRVRLLKVLQSNVCENDCAYCAHRSGRDIRRSAFSPDELARAFYDLVRGGQAEGLFLSSGVCGPVGRASERMLATVELVRQRYQFKGYIHLKILPGAEDASIEAAVKLAHRVSVNLEAPNAERIRALSRTKDFEGQLLAPLRVAHRLRRELGRPVSMTTQFVVGAAQESDRELLKTSSQLYREIDLERAYYSAFQPVPDTPLENHPATPTWREHRLYQADFLLRQYGFVFDDLVFDEQGNLAAHADPKLLWATHHPERFPIEVNTASREDLLRVPGVGPKSASNILGRRRQGRICVLDQLGLPRALAQRAAPFVTLNGRRPEFQLPLWGNA